MFHLRDILMSMLCASNLYTNLMQARVIPGDETSIGKMSPPDWTVSLGYIFLIYVRYMSVQIMVHNKKKAGLVVTRDIKRQAKQGMTEQDKSVSLTSQ